MELLLYIRVGEAATQQSLDHCADVGRHLRLRCTAHCSEHSVVPRSMPMATEDLEGEAMLKGNGADETRKG